MSPGPPRPVREVVRDRPLRVSSLSLYNECLLRLGLETSSCSAILESSPWADFGTAVHAFLERHPYPSYGDWMNFTNSVLCGEIKAHSLALSGRDIPITRILPAGRLLRRIARLRDHLGRQIEVDHGWERDPKHTASVEVDLRGAGGELVGRIDRLDEWSDGRITVTDFKSGPLRKDGNLRGGYVIQVSAYAFLLQERRPTARIRVRLVGADSEWRADFSDDLRTRVGAILSELTKRLPRDVPVSPLELATTGRVCGTCRYRPRCPRYVASAPRFWRDSNSGFPSDRWGRIERVRPRAGSLEVLLREPLGQLALVTGVPKQLMPADYGRGDLLWFFDLRRSQGSSGTLFHILDLEHPELSAHRAMVYHLPAKRASGRIY